MGTNYYYHDVKHGKIHLGKRSGGWRFYWNFHDNEYFSTIHGLVRFIRGGGTIVCENGCNWDVDQFLLMADEWGKPHDLVGDDDLLINGLRVCRDSSFS